MDPRTGTMARHSARSRRTIGLAVVVAATLLAGCTSVAFAVPQAVIWVPGQYTFGIPAGAPDTVGPLGQVVVCSSTSSVLYLQVSEPGTVSMTWTPTGGGESLPGLPDGWLNGPPNFASTDGPLQPGCGTLQYVAHAGDPFPYAGPSTVTVWITTSAPTP